MWVKKAAAANKCTSAVGHFDVHVDAMVQCTQHCPIPHVQGYIRSHWMLPVGNYACSVSVSVLPWRPPGQQSTKQQWKNTPSFLAFSMAIAVCRYVTIASITQWRRLKALLEATGCCHLVRICSNSINWTCQRRFFVLFFIMGRQGKRMAPTNNRGMTYQNDKKHICKMIG